MITIRLICSAQEANSGHDDDDNDDNNDDIDGDNHHADLFGPRS